MVRIRQSTYIAGGLQFEDAQFQMGPGGEVTVEIRARRGNRIFAEEVSLDTYLQLMEIREADGLNELLKDGRAKLVDPPRISSEIPDYSSGHSSGPIEREGLRKSVEYRMRLWLDDKKDDRARGKAKRK